MSQWLLCNSIDFCLSLDYCAVLLAVLCMTCLNPSNSFFTFNKEKLIHLTHFYPNKFSIMTLWYLVTNSICILLIYTIMRSYLVWRYCWSCKESSKNKEWQSRKSFSNWYICLSNYYYYYQLQLLQWRVFFFFPVMHVIKSRLRNRLRDKRINDSLVCIH
jgi:hypothetical protein